MRTLQRALLAALAVAIAAAAAHAGDELAASAPRDDGGKVAVAIEITPLEGELDPGHHPDHFVEYAKAAILTGFAKLAAHDGDEDLPLEADDKVFYMDFHAYRSPAGELFLSSALFSEFDCVTPLYKRERDPCAGRWEEMADVFSSAARDLEAEMWQRIDDEPPDSGECALAPDGDQAHGG